MSSRRRNEDLVQLADPDELLRHVDRLVDDEEWDGLVDLRDRCERAVERGHQLWGVAAHADYRLALEAPARWAAGVLAPERGRFTLGPLAEVVASTHSWPELAPYLEPGPLASLVAFERVARGDDLTGSDADPSAFELPLHLARFEPVYPCPTYRPHEVEVPDPPGARLLDLALPTDPGAAIDDPDAIDALTGITRHWQTHSNGRSSAVAVVGGVGHALRRLGVHRARAAEVDVATALAHLAWAGASGGAHGRRRGAAAGRFEAWWCLAALAGVLDAWPLDAAAMAEAAAPLRWFVWDAYEPVAGWQLRLATEDPSEDLAFAVLAVDDR